MTLITERNGHFYLTSGLEIINPSNEEIASFGFASEIADKAHNNKILWLHGNYVEAEVPNRNGQMWTTNEVAIKSMTPRLMPVTVMHKPQEAIGVIAHTKLLTPEKDGVERAKIDTYLAIWAHRFPEEAAEIKMNHDSGMLMQSMECDSPSFLCSECGMKHIKPIDQHDWCQHLQNGTAVRTLEDTTFTGTGLIFGSRGSQGANPKAQLAVLDEVAEWSDSRMTKKERPKMPDITIDKSEYDELKAKAAKLDDAEKAVAEATADADAAKEQAKEVEDKLTTTEKELETKTDEAASLQAKVTEFEETAAQEELASKRMSEVPAELAKALPEGAKKRLVTKARSLSDEEWTDEIASTAELLKVKTDGDVAGTVFAEEAMSGFNPAGATPQKKEDVENVSAAQLGGFIRNIRKPVTK